MGCGVSPRGSGQKLLLGEAAAAVGLKRLRTGGSGGFWSLLGCDREGIGRVWHPLSSKQRPTRSVRSCGDFTRPETGPAPPAQLLTSSPPVVLDVCPSGSLWMCWDTPQPVLAPQYPCWQELLGLLLYSWRCLWSQTCCPGRTCPPVLCCVSPTPSPLDGAAGDAQSRRSSLNP